MLHQEAYKPMEKGECVLQLTPHAEIKDWEGAIAATEDVAPRLLSMLGRLSPKRIGPSDTTLSEAHDAKDRVCKAKSEIAVWSNALYRHIAPTPTPEDGWEKYEDMPAYHKFSDRLQEMNEMLDERYDTVSALSDEIFRRHSAPRSAA